MEKDHPNLRVGSLGMVGDIPKTNFRYLFGMKHNPQGNALERLKLVFTGYSTCRGFDPNLSGEEKNQ